MPSSDFDDTARALASRMDSDDDQTGPILPTHAERRSNPPAWTRRARTPSGPDRRDGWRGSLDKSIRTAHQIKSRALQTWNSCTPLQRAGLALIGTIMVALLITVMIFRHDIFTWLGRKGKEWRELPGGWAILWILVFATSFPPLFGYSTLVTVAGFVFGMYGWLIVASATVIGSTCALVVSRTLLKDFVGRLTAKNQQFAALALVLKHDGLKLLCLIRICPLPYSLANGAISTIPTVTWQNFMLATAIASPKLLLHIFVGSKLGQIAEDGDKMDMRTRIISYVSIFIGIVVGLGTGYLVYVRTQARAKALEAEAANATSASRRSVDRDSEYADDPSVQHDINIRRTDDDISLHHQTYGEDGLSSSYRDDYVDDDDTERQPVFDVGDDDEDEESHAHIESKAKQRN